MNAPHRKLKYAVLVIAWALAASVQQDDALAQDLKSAALVKQLASAMTNAKLEAIALQDPQAPDRFLAAMLFPGIQLLLVSASHPSPDYVKWQIQQKQYKDVYGLLQQSGLTESRVFFQDLGVDGLPDSGEDSADVMYQQKLRNA